MFSSLKKWLIVKLGGFTDAYSALESIESKERYKLLTLTTKRLFNTIGSDDILKVHESGQWMFEGKPLNETTKKLLIAEAEVFQNSTLWKILQADVKYQANKKLFSESQNVEDMVAGKLWVLTLDAFKTRLKSMKSGSGLFNKN